MQSVKQRVLALLLTGAMLCTYGAPAFAVETAAPAGEADQVGQIEYTYTALPKAAMKDSVKANSEEVPADNAMVNQWKDGLAKAAFDDDTATCWHSNYQFGNDQHSAPVPESCDFSIDWDLQADQSAVQVGRLQYQTKTPSQDNGKWKTIEILATVDGQETSVFSGDITLTDGAATVDFAPVNATHMKVVITQSIGDKNGGNNDNKFAGAGEITVYQATPVTTYTFALDQTEISLEKGKTQQLHGTLTGSDNNAVTEGVSIAWSPENGQFVDVAADGTVTAKAAGTEKVTAAATYNDKTYTAECEVTVTETPAAADVAEVADQTYDTLHAAFADAQAGQTVKLLADVTFGANTEEAAAIEVSQKLVLDLNGFTVVGSGTVFQVNNNGDLTVQDSTENHAGKLIGVGTDSTLENPAAQTICALGNAKVTVASGEVWGACAQDINGAGNLNAIYVDTNAALQVAGNAVVGAAKAENNALNTNYTAVYNMGTMVVTENAKVVGVQAANKVSTEQMFGMNLGLDAVNSANSLTVSGSAQIIGVAGKDLGEAEARAIQAKGNLVLEGGRVEGTGAYGAVLTTDAKLVVRAGKNGEIPVLENTNGPALTMSAQYPNATQDITAGIFQIPAVSEKFTVLKDAVSEGYTTQQGSLTENKWTAAENGTYLKVVKAVAQTFQVTFKSGDKVVESRTVKPGQTLGELPKDPAMEGYVFKGWIDENGKAVTAETVVNGDMMIVARLNKVFQVTIEDQAYQIEAGQTLGDRLPVKPEKDGYVFKGWKDGDGNAVTAETVVNNDMTVTAVWKQSTKPNPPASDTGTSNPPASNGGSTSTSNPPATNGGSTSKPAAGGATATGDTTNLFGWLTLASLMAAGAAASFRKLRGNR